MHEKRPGARVCKDFFLLLAHRPFPALPAKVSHNDLCSLRSEPVRCVTPPHLEAVFHTHQRPSVFLGR